MQTWYIKHQGVDGSLKEHWNPTVWDTAPSHLGAGGYRTQAEMDTAFPFVPPPPMEPQEPVPDPIEVLQGQIDALQSTIQTMQTSLTQVSARVTNITAGTAAMTPGTSTLATGDIYVQYK